MSSPLLLSWHCTGLTLLVPACRQAAAHHEEQVQVSQHIPWLLYIWKSTCTLQKLPRQTAHPRCTPRAAQEDRDCEKDQKEGSLPSKGPQLNHDGHYTGTDCAAALLYRLVQVGATQCNVSPALMTPQQAKRSSQSPRPQAIPSRSPCLSSTLLSLARADISATKSTSTVPTKPPE